MSYSAKIFKIMIASPGDVAIERNTIREVIHEWNDINSETRKIVLLPAGWETHFSPAMGERPQEIINKKILEKCDVLVGVFWTRIGTETGKYLSGSVEEIEKHIELGKPTMLYFSNKPVHPESINQEQYAVLKEFKLACQTRGLYETYDELSEFRQKFFRHLQLKINEDEMFINQLGEELDTTVQSLSMPSQQISKDAQIILKDASLDPNGMILHAHYISGSELSTNGKNYLANQSRRNVAKWEAALEELVANGLVVDKGHQGEIFEITDKGYQLADTLRSDFPLDQLPSLS